MTNFNLPNKILIGIKRKPKELLISIFVSYSILWTILEPILGMIKTAEPYLTGYQKYLFLLLVSCSIGIYRIIPPNEIIINYNSSVIKIIFGDLFSYEDFKVIPVSRFFFETEVVTTSLQHKVIRKFIDSDEGIKGLDKYIEKLSAALENENFQNKYREATQQEENYYLLGTTACIELNTNNIFLLFAITKTELRGYIPSDNSSVSNMWIALNRFWNEARRYSRGKAINIPLLGSGITGINLPPVHILQLNLLAIFNSIIENGKITTNEIRIILHQDYFENIDIESIGKIWIGK